ncbi:LysR family transcriptional regulator [Acetobacter orleanensis]|uniref:LysR family transcriptional regulator n=1 Tax=Acetobacter orleanensis TaxID=104099 RepID=A0A4Y3TRE9_9PROT|nr:LysR family transcriptional regulator [Acetobacter orleanensis]KXV65721.1 LysR family transcriptional regulator [Acetobacter orleanensis]PCD78612.1 LysR family transcriptional regulator [Acetobacter orleanensis]GAN67331.1 transcriptional regulator LysR [Acetobacter orleanensis JCM 7639]GBR23330.1 transcriptional regulator [Acetobacter orleanensis NRIC 0473]GEB83590.1 LysR family transcriptional regulator [Acetobacter orleanensis]
MDLRVLRSFVAVAEERSFTHAAERLHIAQPPLSRQIQQLEREIGAQLIDRSARPLQLTTVGQLVYEQARQILGRVNDMREMVARVVHTEKRRITMAYVSTVLHARLPDIIRDFRIRAPNVDLSLVELVTIDQITALKEGRIDLGWGRLRLQDDAIQRIVLREEKLIAAVPEKYTYQEERDFISLSELTAYPLIVFPRYPRPSYADQVLTLFHDHGLDPHIGHEASELQSAISLVAAEEGISIVPESVRRWPMDGVRYLELAEDASSPIILSYRKGDNSPELVAIAEAIASMYSIWDYEIPEAILTLARR